MTRMNDCTNKLRSGQLRFERVLLVTAPVHSVPSTHNLPTDASPSRPRTHARAQELERRDQSSLNGEVVSRAWQSELQHTGHGPRPVRKGRCCARTKPSILRTLLWRGYGHRLAILALYAPTPPTNTLTPLPNTHRPNFSPAHSQTHNQLQIGFHRLQIRTACCDELPYPRRGEQ